MAPVETRNGTTTGEYALYITARFWDLFLQECLSERSARALGRENFTKQYVRDEHVRSPSTEARILRLTVLSDKHS